MAIIDNTIKLTAEFKTFDDEYANPSDITLVIYNRSRKQVGDTIDIDSSDRVSTGIYQYFYTIPTGYADLVYEFSGSLEGYTITGRSTITCDWT